MDIAPEEEARIKALAEHDKQTNYDRLKQAGITPTQAILDEMMFESMVRSIGGLLDDLRKKEKQQ